MKRLHLHVNVENLDEAVPFYATLFGAEPSIRKADYAKWLLEDPGVNFAISSRGRTAGLDHLGIQVDSAAELAETAERLKAANRAVFEQTQATCCYAVSDKAWSVDPAGLSWETFYSIGASTHYGDDGVDPAGPPQGPVAQAAGGSTAETCCSPVGRDRVREADTGRCC